MRLRPGAPLSAHLVALAGSGWGPLASEVHGVRSVLRGLGECLARERRDMSGAGLVTVAQLAGRCGYSTRWVGVCLARLEELGVIEWSRGSVVNGQPVASWFRVNKALLCDMVAVARAAWDAVQRDRYLAFLARKAATPWFSRIGRYNRRSVHVEVDATLPPYGEVPPPSRGRVGGDPPPRGVASSDPSARAAAARAELRAARRNAVR